MTNSDQNPISQEQPKEEMSQINDELVRQSCAIGSALAASLSKRALLNESQAVLGLVQTLATVNIDRAILRQELEIAKATK